MKSYVQVQHIPYSSNDMWVGREVSSRTFRSLKKKALPYPERSGPNYPARPRHVPEERNPLHDYSDLLPLHLYIRTKCWQCRTQRSVVGYTASKDNFTELSPSWDRNSRSAGQGMEPDGSLQCSQQSSTYRVAIHTSPVSILTLLLLNAHISTTWYAPIHAYVSHDNFSLPFYV
jgi:hypothetical protein